jgi:hypothetical protein
VTMQKDLRPHPRWLQRLRAYLGHYFWLPCPICNQYFGGHEPLGSLYLGNNRGRVVCANCAAEAERRSAVTLSAEFSKKER